MVEDFNQEDRDSYKENKKSTKSNSKRSRRKGKGRSSKQNKRDSVNYNSNTSGESRHIHGSAKENGANDVNWYTHIYSVSEPLARVSYNIMTGSRYNPIGSGTVRPSAGPNPWPVKASVHADVDPGIMALDIQPVLGDSDAANLAATQLYSLVRQANSGAKNYDKTDLMMMVMAMDSAYMVYEYLLRAFRVCKSWDYLNRYTPEILLQSMHFSKNIMTELANFEATLNLFAYRLSALCVPDQFDFIHRHSWLFSNVYEDEDNGRAQMYVMNPKRFYIWTEGEDDQPTYLEPKLIENLITPVSGIPVGYIGTVSQVQDLIDAVLTPLYGSEDVGLMNGDLIKAFGDAGMIKINPVDNSPLVPVHNDEVLEQIMNADVLCDKAHQVTFTNLNITQDLNSLAAGPQLSQVLSYTPVDAVAPRNAVKSLLNAFDDLSSDRVITSTRLKFTISYSRDPQSGNKLETIESCGTEFVESVTIYFRGEGGTISTSNISPRIIAGTSTNYELVEVSKFRYHPTIYVFSIGSSEWIYQGYFQDTAVTAWLDDEWINKMNEVAILSEYAVKDFKTGIS